LLGLQLRSHSLGFRLCSAVRGCFGMCCHDCVTALTSQDSDLFENSERYRQDESSSPCTATLSFIQFIRNLISLKTDSHMASRCVHLRLISFLMT